LYKGHLYSSIHTREKKTGIHNNKGQKPNDLGTPMLAVVYKLGEVNIMLITKCYLQMPTDMFHLW